MEVSARTKNLSVSVKKLRLLVEPLRGQRVEEALISLQFTPSPWARSIAKVVRSAAANAETNFEMDPGMLRIVRVDIGPAPTLKRYYPRARGQAGPQFRRHSNLRVVVDDEEAQ
ncbi:MAG: 50S ribosomal protein L22 [Dehalococcoidia bacterium]|jgi:large subunit ribosomal protein L22|nr:50S ribosomal protein L22 [Dehalococcoidia bacterium]